jgi:2-oxo-4-hydroxy-4-carboxy-5-ureidoimidazoline decarboxylase
VTDPDALDREEFLARFGGLYEHSPWVAEEAWERRPFGDAAGLAAAFEAAVLAAPEERRVALLRAHPELAGREARAGELTAASAGEQAGAGLDRLSRDQAERLARLNADYRERFGFPFVIAVHGHTPESILAAGEARLDSPRAAELETAIDEVLKIARARLAALTT